MEAASRIPSYHPLVLVLAAAIVGILVDWFFDFHLVIYLAAALVGLVAWGLVLVADRRLRFSGWASRTAGTILLLFLVGSSFGGWHQLRWNYYSPLEIGLYAPDRPMPVCLEGVVASEPRMLAPMADDVLNPMPQSERTRMTLRLKRVRDGKSWLDARGIADLIVSDHVEHLRSGDHIRLFGKFVSISASSNPGQFDFQEFYRARDRFASIRVYQAESIEVLKPANRFSLTGIQSNLRRKLNEITWRHVAPERAGFASAILLGNREQLSSSRRELFLITGTVHLLAISGLHVGILAGSFFWLFRLGFLSRRKCLIATILFVVFYAWLVEFRPPVTRAAILLVLYCISRLVGREGYWYNLLALAGVIVLLLNPHDLFSIGPQLSFLAVATITFAGHWIFWPPSSDPLDRLIASTRPFHVRTFYWLGRQTRTMVMVSAMIWLMAIPLVAIRFHIVAPISLIVNPLLMIPITLALYAGLGVLVFGWICPPLADWCGSVCDWNLSMIEGTIASAQAVPGSHFWTAGPLPWSVALFYFGVLFFVIYPPTKVVTRWGVLLGAGWLVFCWWVPDQVHQWSNRNSDSPLAITFVDVGHGSCTLVEFPDGRNMLYDAGCMGSPEYGLRNVCSVLWHRRIKHLDAIVLSHADVDHFNAVPDLCERFSIGKVYLSPMMASHSNRSVGFLLEQLHEKGVVVDQVGMADQLLTGSDATSFGLKVLWPDIDEETVVGGEAKSRSQRGSDNAQSVVLEIEHQGFRVLLAGDLEGAGMEFLLGQRATDYDLVMAPHHGSINSRPYEFANWSTPEYVVVSGGGSRVKEESLGVYRMDNRALFRTDQDGAIRFEINNGKAACWSWNVSQSPSAARGRGWIPRTGGFRPSE